MDLAAQDSDDEGLEVKPLEQLLDQQEKSATTNQLTSEGQYPIQAKHSLALPVPARDSLMLNSNAETKPDDRGQTFHDASLEGNLHNSALSRP